KESHPDFPDFETGTVLIIERIRSNFSGNDISKIHSAIKRMKSPFKGAEDFNVTIEFQNCPEEWDKYSEIESTDILDKAPFKFTAIVDDNGDLDYEYQFSFPGFKKREISGK